MNLIYPFLITFLFIFLSELGDKTQLLVLSFSTKGKASFVLLGVAIGTFFSHGLAIVKLLLSKVILFSFTFLYLHTYPFYCSGFLVFILYEKILKKKMINLHFYKGFLLFV